jgi:hypothetical protein
VQVAQIIVVHHDVQVSELAKHRLRNADIVDLGGFAKHADMMFVEAGLKAIVEADQSLNFLGVHNGK